jgi:hypothetical protein
MTAGTTVSFVAGGGVSTLSTNGDVNGGGQPGLFGYRITGTAGVSGYGGSSSIGGGGSPRVTASPGAGIDAIGPGAAGGGALVINGSAAAIGGAGSKGLIYIYEYQ